MNQSARLRKKSDTETSKAPTATITAMKEDEVLREAPRKAQREFGEFDPNDVYHTLVDPFPRTRQEMVEYAKEAAQVYETGRLVSVQELLDENFYFWIGKQLKILPSSVVSGIRNSLPQEHMSVEARPGLQMSSALANYIACARKNNIEMPNSTNGKASKVEIDADESVQYLKSLFIDIIDKEADDVSQSSIHG